MSRTCQDVEGRTRIPGADATAKGPGAKRRDAPFYNPAMAWNRDLSVAAVRAECTRRGRELDVADVLCGAGARTLRLLNEVDAPIVVHANDGDPKALAALEAGRRANHLSADRLRTTHGDAHVFLAAQRYDILDVDPFGSPAPFLDGAMRAVRHDGLVCLTATDTAALAGTYPRVCRRRYAAWHGLHAAPWRTEVGLRILAAAAVQAAARYERSAVPVLSVAQGHWMRVLLRVRDGRNDADRCLKALGWATLEPDGTGRLHAGPVPPERPDGRWAGPLWTGALHDRDFTRALQDHATDLATPDAADRFTLYREESAAPAFWVDPGTTQAALRLPAPRRQRFRDALQDAGFQAAPTHMDVQGTRTDATGADLIAAWKAAKA